MAVAGAPPVAPDSSHTVGRRQRGRLYVAIGCVGVVLVIVVAAALLSWGPFHTSNPPRWGPAFESYYQSRSTALAFDNSSGGGPWVVSYALERSLSESMSVQTKFLYPYSDCGFPGLNSSAATANVTISSDVGNITAGLSPFWVIWTVNPSSEFREVMVANGVPSLLGDASPTLKCGYSTPGESYDYPTIDSTSAEASALAAGGSSFMHVVSNVSVAMYLTTYGYSIPAFSWVVSFSDCLPLVGQEPGSGHNGAYFVVTLNGTTGTPIGNQTASGPCAAA